MNDTLFLALLVVALVLAAVDLSRRFGVSVRHIYNIKSGKVWAD